MAQCFCMMGYKHSKPLDDSYFAHQSGAWCCRNGYGWLMMGGDVPSNSLQLNMAIEIVDSPINNCDFP